ncbi:MAG: IS66 family transposase [Myxococcota bacterium]
MVDVAKEKDPEQLRRIAQTALSEVQRQAQVIASMGAELDRLRGHGGATQEALGLLERLKKAEEKTAAPSKKSPSKGKKKKRARSGPAPQPELEVETRRYELDEADRVCTSCGGALREFEGQTDDSEMIDVVEVSYRLVKVQRQKYVCDCGGCVETALGPERAAPGSRYSLDFAVKAVVDKYCDHLPLERQTRILKRHGLKVTSQTLWKQLEVLARDLQPVYEALRAHVILQPVMGLDQTSWKRLSDKKRTPFQMWCLTSPGVVVHAIEDDKSKATFFKLLGEDYEGTVVCDAMSTHISAARGSPRLQLAACWAHVHRKFAESADDHPEAQRGVDFIRRLYELDAESVRDDASVDMAARAEVRATRSKAVLTEMHTWLKDLEVLTSTSFGAAARYAFGNWPNLVRFADDACIPLDNNATERGIRGPVVGRKNHYGSKSKRGTEVASIFYSLIETAKLNHLNPAAYLRDAVLAARRGQTLLPISA